MSEQEKTDPLNVNEETKETPSVTINVVNNEELEQAMYESEGK